MIDTVKKMKLVHLNLNLKSEDDKLPFILKSVSDLPTEPEKINLKIKRNYPLFQNPFPISNVKSVSKCLFLCLFPFLVFRDHYRCPFSASIPV